MASVDSPEDNRGFAEKNEASFPILSDPERAMAEAYGVLSGPGGYARRWTFYIDAEGKIIEIDKGVSPSTAGADLVANLEALAVPKSAE